MKIILFTVILFVSSLSADLFSDANKAYENGDLKKASGLITKSCDNLGVRN